MTKKQALIDYVNNGISFENLTYVCENLIANVYAGVLTGTEAQNILKLWANEL